MKAGRVPTGFWIVVVLAALGAFLVWVPPYLIEQAQGLSDLGRPWLIAYLIVVGSGGLLLLTLTVVTIWKVTRGTRRKKERRRRQAQRPRDLSPGEREQQVEENLDAIRDLEGDEELSPEMRRELEPLIRQIESKRQDRTLEIVAFGTISSGKSSLLNALAGRDVFRTDPRGGTTLQRSEVPWPGADRVLLVDTPGLGEIDGMEGTRRAADAAKDADLVLLVVDGPLRDSEFELLALLGEMDKRVLVCLNKGDWYDEDERNRLLGQLVQQVREQVAAEDVVAVQARPSERTRIRVLPDGTESEEPVGVEANIQPLAQRMMAIVDKDGRDLLLANLLLQSRGLVEEARQRVRESLDKRARQIVDRYAWGAGGAAALSPLPILDLVAGSAVSTKMVLELARVYRQEIDVETVVRLMGQLGKNLVAILGTSAAAPAIVSAVASLMKTVPGAGTLAGGMLQGIVQALITRWIGAVFIRYFQNEMQHPEGGMAAMARREWERLTRPTELRNFIVRAREHEQEETSL